MLESVQIAVYVAANVLFWLLALRVIVAALKLDPYHPTVQFLYRITEPLLKPFARVRRRPRRIDPAVFPPMVILLLIILILGLRVWWWR